jgi:hypothetical protein
MLGSCCLYSVQTFTKLNPFTIQSTARGSQFTHNAQFWHVLNKAKETVHPSMLPLVRLCYVCLNHDPKKRPTFAQVCMAPCLHGLTNTSAVGACWMPRA